MTTIRQTKATPRTAAKGRAAWVRAAAKAADPARRRRLQWALACLIPIAAAALQWRFRPYLDAAAWPVFLPAVFLVSWLCGRAAGLLATALSATLGWWYLVPPVQVLDKGFNAELSVGVFLGMGILFGEFHGAYRRANLMLRNSRLQYARLFELAPDAAFIADSTGRLVTVNAAYCRLLGYEQGQMRDRNIAEVIPPDDLAPLHQVLALLERDGKGQAEWHFLHCNGVALACEVNASILPDGTWQGLVRDISERRRVESQLKHTAHHDALTGLPNRLRFCVVLQSALERARRNQHKLALLYIDLDRFKEVNDTLGRGAGDLLLQEISRRLVQCVRAGDTVSRLGGDEFTMVLEGIGAAEDAGEVARKIIATVREPVELGGHAVSVSASIGISIFPDDAQTTQTLSRNADAALYRAKDRGRDTYELCPPELVKGVEVKPSLPPSLKSPQPHSALGLCGGTRPTLRKTKAPA